MAIDFTTLTGAKSVSGSIRNWLNRSDVPAEDVLTEAQAFVWQRLRVREMQATATVMIALDADTASLPSDFLDPVELRLYGWSDPLPYVHEALLEAHRDEDGDLYEGPPSRWTAIGTTLHIDTATDAALNGKLIYYAKPAALSGSNETNILTDKWPTLLRQTCLHFAFQHAKSWDEAAQMLPLAMKSIDDANALSDLSRRGQYA